MNIEELIIKLKEKLDEEIKYLSSTSDIRDQYAKNYAYEALIKNRFHDADGKKKRDAENNAFWQDGSKDGISNGLYTLNQLKKWITQIESELNSKNEN